MTCAGEFPDIDLKRYKLNEYDFCQINDSVSDTEMINAIKDADVVYLAGDSYFSKYILEGAPKLKLIAFGGIGYESFIDVQSASDLGIAIANTPQTNSDSVAEFAIGLLLGIQRNIVNNNNLMKQGVKNRIISREIRGQKIGIIGMGAIGSRITKILKNGFEVDVSYYNKTRKKEIEEKLGAKYKSLQVLLRESDIVFIAIPENSSTCNFINKNEFNIMKNTAILINPARPKLINPEALYEALINKKIAACAMDGYYTEPKEDKYGLLKLDDSVFVCTSDIACRTVDAWRRTDEIALKNIYDFFKAGTSKNIVNPEYNKRK